MAMLNDEHDQQLIEIYQAQTSNGQAMPEGAAASHLRLGERRDPQQDRVSVFTPSVSRDGWSVGGTIIQTVTDDRPFLVDAVRSLVESLGHRVHEIIHPVFDADRDDQGHLTGLAVREHDDSDASNDESWIHLEIGRLDGEQAHQELADQLHRVLAEVRVAVQDWNEMSAQLWQCANQIEDREWAELVRLLAEEHFTFLGRVRYTVAEGRATLEPRSALGLARKHLDVADLPLGDSERWQAWQQLPVWITEGQTRPIVRPEGRHDLIAVKIRDDAGTIIAEERFVGVLSPGLAMLSVDELPVVRHLVTQALVQLNIAQNSHAGRTSREVLDVVPRRMLFNATVDEIAGLISSHQRGAGRPRPLMHAQFDALRRHVSFFIELPRERYSTRSRLEITQALREAVNGVDVSYETRASDDPMAMLFFVVRVAAGEEVPPFDVAELLGRVSQIGRDWGELLRQRLEADLGEDEGQALAHRYLTGLPAGFSDAIPVKHAVNDLRRLAGLGDGGAALHLYRPGDAAPGVRRLKLYLPQVATLSQLLPLFNDLGVVVTDEMPFRIQTPDGEQHLLDLGLVSDEEHWAQPGAADRFQAAVLAGWRGEVESDRLQSLVLTAGLDLGQVVVLRAITAYLRQLGMTYSAVHAQSVLCDHPQAAALLVDLFEARFDPDGAGGLVAGAPERAERVQQVLSALEAELDQVPSLDHETILRNCRDVIEAALRTNWYLAPRPSALVLKLAPGDLGIAPQPRPSRELFVHGPQVEGVHLRFGMVARGGLRWSDRREDFRTEILGLVKAQVVKNAVIVPAGAKGGFYAKWAPNPALDRDRWLEEGKAAYRAFITAMLEVSDNLVEGAVVAPDQVVRHDGDDTYLVVAADKGTATFSDLANEIAERRGFWLGDAFASGGSVGFDHKAMGITARGAWESVRRHFRERGLDTQTEGFTVAGVGDMSGDVFGNGMLRTRTMSLVAAFDHRDIFLDPSPDPEASYGERERLFRLLRSSWADYDTTLISAGGGVWSRQAKSVPLSSQVRELLDVDDEALTPDQLIQAILRAPVDLLWNGGIGTYVKDSAETHGEVGDRANDHVRVNAEELRCRVIGEGGNLGLTQRARIRAALAGIGVNTDAIDNSAGVDTSDHEVNIKIALKAAIEAGLLGDNERDQLLADLVEPVAEAVLRTNYEQNVLIGNARAQDGIMVGPHLRLLAELERETGLDRGLELLPSDEVLLDRERHSGQGLSAPEFSVVMAWTKLWLKAKLAGLPMLSDPWCEGVLRRYFPPILRERFPEQLTGHPLADEITATVLANHIVNRGGVTFTYRAIEETGASLDEVVRAFVVAREAFNLDGYVAEVEELDGQVSTDVQAELYLGFRRLLDHVVRRLIWSGALAGGDLATLVDRFSGVASALTDLSEFLIGNGAATFDQRVQHWSEAGVPEELARWAAGLINAPALVDAAAISERLGVATSEVLQVWFALVDELQLDGFFAQIAILPHEDRWDAKARAVARNDAHQAVAELVVQVLAEPGEGDAASPTERVSAFLTQRGARTESARLNLAQVSQLEPQAGLAALSVALRALQRISSP